MMFYVNEKADAEKFISREVVGEIPNAETSAALNEVEDMKAHPENYQSYKDVDAMMKDLLK